MKVIPHLNAPEANDVLQYLDKLPCPTQVERIIQAEMLNGNIILSAADVAFMTSETAVIILFQELTKNDYPNLITKNLKNGHIYQCLYFSDNKGAMEFRFGF